MLLDGSRDFLHRLEARSDRPAVPTVEDELVPVMGGSGVDLRKGEPEPRLMRPLQSYTDETGYQMSLAALKPLLHRNGTRKGEVSSAPIAAIHGQHQACGREIHWNASRGIPLFQQHVLLATIAQSRSKC